MLDLPSSRLVIQQLQQRQTARSPQVACVSPLPVSSDASSRAEQTNHMHSTTPASNSGRSCGEPTRKGKSTKPSEFLTGRSWFAPFPLRPAVPAFPGFQQKKKHYTVKYLHSRTLLYLDSMSQIPQRSTSNLFAEIDNHLLQRETPWP